MMSLFRDDLAGSTLISIAHRPHRTLNLVKTDTGARLVTKRRSAATNEAARVRSFGKKILKSLVGGAR
jgi:hypothetical protein